ncbi:MAG: DUF2306 domain-containing protein [Aquabacterium sp.]|uniref:DUF2306 domain-containing protein n=1 Tax=Aquabacterium sp. TaxID=1872578 RepID=UPI001216F0C8|nr:DUF2306 domain-containing protein [Aquabacterium sp.]TAK93373.1 MAG: DUF2306 domain-containing protein [Aquabacterium sp.]
MSTSSPALRSTTSGSFNWLSTLYVVLIALVMSGTGWLALREASTRYLLPFQSDNVAELAQHQARLLRDKPTLDNIQTYSPELATLARGTDPQRFVDSKLIEHGLYLAQMPKLNQVLLASHIFTGVACMLLGGWQFWPAFRKRFMRLHRMIGGIYIVTVPISVLLSFAYLTVTAPHNLYTRLAAWVALWLFGTVALFSVAAAVHALRQKRIHEHMGYMALSFACMLVAPILRLNWVMLAWLFPHIDQETLSLVTMGIMMPECLLIGYGLIQVNRQYERAMTRRTPSDLTRSIQQAFQRAMPLWYALALGALLISVVHFGAGLGMSSTDSAHKLVNTALLERESTVLQAHPLIRNVFALSVGLALLLGLHLFNRMLNRAPSQTGTGHLHGAARRVLMLSLMAGASAIYLGWHIGLAPAQQWLSGGTLYTTSGLLILAFSGLLAGNMAKGHLPMMKESLAFLLSVLPFAPLLLVNLWLLQWLPIPADYIQQGQAYVLAAGACGVPMFAAMFHAVLGQAGREHG